jgi:hypothetical protein
MAGKRKSSSRTEEILSQARLDAEALAKNKVVQNSELLARLVMLQVANNPDAVVAAVLRAQPAELSSRQRSQVEAILEALVRDEGNQTPPHLQHRLRWIRQVAGLVLESLAAQPLRSEVVAQMVAQSGMYDLHYVDPEMQATYDKPSNWKREFDYYTGQYYGRRCQLAGESSGCDGEQRFCSRPRSP